MYRLLLFLLLHAFPCNAMLYKYGAINYQKTPITYKIENGTLTFSELKPNPGQDIHLLQDCINKFIDGNFKLFQQNKIPILNTIPHIKRDSIETIVGKIITFDVYCKDKASGYRLAPLVRQHQHNLLHEIYNALAVEVYKYSLILNTTHQHTQTEHNKNVIECYQTLIAMLSSVTLSGIIISIITYLL